MSWTPPTLQTPRLILRAVRLEDAPSIYSYSRSPNVARYTLWQAHQAPSDAETFIRDYAFQNYENKVCEPFGITLKTAPDLVIGTCGAWWSSEKSSVMEMGYALAQEYWSQGYMSEAVRAVIDHCFRSYPVNRIQAHFKSENVASGKVMEKVGMKFEGTQRQRVFHNDRFWDTVHYAILRSDWNR